MRAGKKETASLLGIAEKCIVKVSVHVPVKRNKDGSLESESVIKDDKEKESACWMEKKEVSMQKQEFIPGGWKSQREVSIV